MAKVKDRRRTVFICPSCGNENPKWMGFCPALGCGSQSPLVETSLAPETKGRPGWLATEAADVVELSSISGDTQPRDPLPSMELNRVLGGGVVPGSVVLLAGEPGVGKSTLLLQLAQYSADKGQKVLYVSGEESPQQIKLRSDRLGFAGDGIMMLAETDLTAIFEKFDSIRPDLAIVDSIQTLYTEEESSGPGLSLIHI